MKRILAYMLSLCILFSAVDFHAWATETQSGDDQGHTHCACSAVLTGADCVSHSPQMTWQPWEPTDSLPTAAGNYYLTGDVQLKGKEPDVRISGTADVKLCLNGHNISLAKSDSGTSYRISVWDAASRLTIMDCRAQLSTADDRLEKGGTITGSSYGTNGALYARGGEMKLIGVEVSGNTNGEKTATYGGGAIQIRNGAKVTAEYVRFRNNTAGSDGGAICVKSGSLYARNTSFAGNTAGISGGAVYLENGSCSAVLESCDVRDNTAAGAAIYVHGATVTMENVTMTGNENNGTGGGGSAVHTAAGGKATLHNCTVTGNQNSKVTNYAGAVYVPNGNSSITVSGRTVIDQNTVGGTAKEVNVFLQSVGAKLTVGQLAEGSGIGITTLTDYALTDDPDVFLTKAAGITTWDPAWNSRWIVYENISAAVDHSEEKGFFLFFDTTDMHVHAACACAISGAEADCAHQAQDGLLWKAWTSTDSLPTAAGNYYLTEDVQLKGKEPDVRISGTADVKLCLNGHNISLAKSDSDTSYRISVWDAASRLTIMDCKAQPNAATGQLEKGGTITGSSYGTNGALYARGGEMKLIGVEVSGNTNGEKTATYGGGAIQIRNGAKVTAEYVRFRNNTAGSDGGAICVKGGSLHARNTSFAGNTAGINGGALYLENGSCSAVLENCRMDGNQAAGQGGAVYGSVGSTLNGQTVAICDNRAAGAAVHLNGAVAAFDLAVITGNVNSVDGASALHVANGSTAQLKDCAIIGNQNPNRTEYCGGVYVPNSRSKLTISGCMVVDNNTVGTASKEANIFLQDADVKLEIGQLDEDSRIGITTHKTYTAKEDPDAFLVKAENAAQWNVHWVVYENTRMNVAYSDQENFFFVAITDHNHCVCDNTGATGCQHTKEAWLPWDAADRLPTNSGNYYLTTDVVLGSAVSLKGEADVKLCLNGKTVTVQTEAENAISSVYQLFDSAVLTISDCTATDGKNAYVAGELTGAQRSAIWLEAGSAQAAPALYIYAGIIGENHSAISGGAIRLNGNNVCYLYGGEICGNSGVSAGAVYVNNGSAIHIFGGTIRDNAARNNEAKTEGFAGAILLVRGSQLYLHGGSITNNAAVSGGAVYATGEAKVSVLGGRIGENTAQLHGGAIAAIENSTVAVTGGTVESNKAKTGQGGAVYAEKATVSISGGKLSGNTAKVGGGLYMGFNTTLQMSGGEISKNYASETGGGIQHYLSTASYTGGKIQSNTAGKNGGGICTSQKCRLSLKGATVTGNTAAESGGGVLLQGYESVLDFSSGTVSGNQAQMGGGIFVSTNTTLNMSGGEVSANAATQSGGGIQQFLSTANYTGGSIHNNTSAKNGGGLCTSQKCQVNLKGTVIRENQATEAGGGILLQGYESVMNFGSGVVQGNAAQTGGGMYISTNTTLNMTGGTVSENTAELTGGGIQQLLSTANYKGGTIENNTTAGNGAGICTTQKCHVVLDGTKIAGNSAQEAGGGVLIQGYESTMRMASGEICGNQATLGAGLFGSVNTALSITGGSVFGNAAGEDGGGIYLYYSTAAVSGGSVYENTAQLAGGGVFSTNSKVEMCDLTISGNTAQTNGGGICAGQMDFLTLKNVQIADNTAAQSGGGLYLGIGSTTRLEQVSVTGNQAKAHGGALYAIDNLTMAGLTASENASGTGGAVYLDASGFDGRSYMAGVMIMSGDMRICDNSDSPADLFIGEGTALSVGPEGLGENTKICVTLASGVLTNTVFGAYDYQGGDGQYVITYGDRSLYELEQFEAPAQDVEPETEPVPETSEPEEKEQEESNALLPVALGVGVIAIVAAILAVVLWRKGKNRRLNGQTDKE